MPYSSTQALNLQPPVGAPRKRLRHGGAGEEEIIELDLSAMDGGRVRVQVSDPGVGFEHTPRDQPIDEEGGWGLVLIESMAESWGFDREERTSVWFELAPPEAA
jgi:two-component sensor histidine kinase